MWQFFTSGGSKKSKTASSSQAGLIVAYGSATPPTGWLSCNGASVSTTTYATLFGLIGYTYGGSGASFLLPDLSARVPMGSYAGAQDGGTGGGSASPSAITGGTAIAAKTVGTTGGETTHITTAAESSTPAHSHTYSNRGYHRHQITDPGHTHSVPITSTSVTNSGTVRYFPTNQSSGVFATDISYGSPYSTPWTTISVANVPIGGRYYPSSPYYATIGLTPYVGGVIKSGGANATSAHENRQKYTIANYIIKT